MSLEEDFYLRRGLFIPKDREKLLGHDLSIYPSLGRTHLQFKEGLNFIINPSLNSELITRTLEKPAHKNEFAFDPQLFIPDSANLPLAQQDGLARIYVNGLVEKLGLTHVGGGISRIADYEEVILQHIKKSRLLKKGIYLFPSARTRTRVYPERVGSENYIPYIGPFEEEGLRVGILSREEGDPEVGVWVLLYPLKNTRKSVCM